MLTNVEVSDIYVRYGALILRRCRAILRDDALADDAFQETFIKLMRHGAAFRQATSGLRWLYAVSDRCCFDQLAKRKAQSRDDLRRELAAVEAQRPSGPDFELRELVTRFLHRLDDDERRLAVLAWIDELDQGQIAEEIGASRQTVNKKLGRIVARARAYLGGRDG